jgi:cytochrome b561
MDRLRSTGQAAPRATRYTRVAMLLHWLIAVLVLSTIPLGVYSTLPLGTPVRPVIQVPQGAAARPALPPPKTAAQQSTTNIHKTIGICILFLTVLRVGWRLTHKPPALPDSMARPLRWLARASHAMFYFLLLVMPLSGWWTSSAVPDPMRHAFGFGFFDIPFLPLTQSWPSAGAARFVHTNLAWLMIGLALLHIVAALKHHFVDKDDVLKRMLPQRS